MMIRIICHGAQFLTCSFVMLFTRIKHTLLGAPARVGFRVEEYHSATVFGEILQDTRPMMSTEDAMVATVGRSQCDLPATSCSPAPRHPQRNPVPDVGLPAHVRRAQLHL